MSVVEFSIFLILRDECIGGNEEGEGWVWEKLFLILRLGGVRFLG